MMIVKCELCLKEITDSTTMVRAGLGERSFLPAEFCETYGKPVVLFLKRVQKKMQEREKQAGKK